MSLLDIDNYTVATATMTLFNRGQHDPSFGEIYAEATQEEDGRFTLLMANEMRTRIGKIKEYLNSFGVGVIVLSGWYYRPFRREDYDWTESELDMPPSFREQPPTTPEEAGLCLASAGMRRVPFGLLYAKSKNPALKPIITRAASRNAKQVAGRARGLINSVADSYLALQITEEEALNVLRAFDDVLAGDPNDPRLAKRREALSRIGAVLPKMVPIAAE